MNGHSKSPSTLCFPNSLLDGRLSSRGWYDQPQVVERTMLWSIPGVIEVIGHQTFLLCRRLSGDCRCCLCPHVPHLKSRSKTTHNSPLRLTNQELQDEQVPQTEHIFDAIFAVHRHTRTSAASKTRSVLSGIRKITKACGSGFRLHETLLPSTSWTQKQEECNKSHLAPEPSARSTKAPPVKNLSTNCFARSVQHLPAHWPNRKMGSGDTEARGSTMRLLHHPTEAWKTTPERQESGLLLPFLELALKTNTTNMKFPAPGSSRHIVDRESCDSANHSVQS